MKILIIFILLLPLISANYLCDVSVDAGITKIENFEMVDSDQSSDLGGLVSSLTSTYKRWVNYLGINVYLEEEIEEIQEFEIYAFSSELEVNLNDVITGDIYQTSEEVDIQGVFGIWETLFAYDTQTSADGYMVNSQNGQSLLIVPNGIYDLYTIFGEQINLLYYGVTNVYENYDELDIKDLEFSELTNDNLQVWEMINAPTGSDAYLTFAFPVRLGIVSFWVGGFNGGFEDPVIISITNDFTEDYYVWRSTHSNLGICTVETKDY